MDSFKKSIIRIYKGSIKAFQTFPVSIGSAMAFAIVTMIRIQLDWPQQEAYNFLFNCLHWAFALGAIFSLASITAAKSLRNTDKAFKFANLLGVLVVAGAISALYFFGAKDTAQYTSRAVTVSGIAAARVSAAMVVSMLAFIVLAGNTSQESDFARSFFMTHKAFFIAAIYGIVIMGGASGVAGAIQALLYNDMSSKVYMYIATIAGFLAFTIFAGYFPDFRKGEKDEHREVAQKQPRFIEVLFEFIMVPIMIAMTIVLILWAGRTIFIGDWPPFEELAGIASSYAFVGIWLHIMVTHGNSGLSKFYRRAYPAAALLILAFEAWALMVRIGDFGIKTTEYYFMLTWIVAVAASIILLLMGKKAHRIVVAVICIIVIFSVLPVTGYNDLPVTAQVNRLENLLYGEGMFEEGEIVPAEEEPELTVRQSITDAVVFLSNADDADLPEWFEGRLGDKNTFKERFGFDQVWPERDDYYRGDGTYLGISLTFDQGPVAIDGYEWAIRQRIKGEGEEPTSVYGERGVYGIYWIIEPNGDVPFLKITLDDETIIEHDMNEYIDRITEKYPLGERSFNEAPFEDMSVRLESEEVEVLLVFGNIDISVNPREDRINYWLSLDAIYLKEKQ